MDRISSKTNEMDLLTITLTLWGKRTVLAAATLGFVAAGILLAYARTSVYEGKIVINPLTEAELTGFHKWNQGVSRVASFDWRGTSTLDASFNSFLFPSEPTASLKSAIATPESLGKKFRIYFQRGEALNSALRQHSKEIENFKGDELEIAALLTKLRRNFVLEEDKSGEVSITITTTDKARSIQILSTVVEVISQAVKQDILKSINSILDAKELSRKLEIERLSVEFEAHKRLYEFKKNQSLTLLREQASVARILNLENPLVNGDPKQPSTGVFNFAKNELDLFESSYFLQGYDAIEKQIANVETRDDGDIVLMAGNGDDLILIRERLARYNTSEILRPLIKDSPYHDPDFIIINVDLNNLDFISKTNKTLSVSIVSAVGFLLSVVAILVTHALKQGDTQKGVA